MTEDALCQSLDAFEQTSAQMKAAFEAQSENWKLDLIRLRKIQASQLSALSESLAGWSHDRLDAAAGREITALFIAMRRAISMTQTIWPLSLIKDPASLEAYTLASRQTIEASEAFFAWMRLRLQRP
ncbi:hypothetical protein C1T17_04205 [Sphingobium sp. SCG-1]|uniref:hypothetical protein n=1 Tax=Sphingobium sp. SCG-1 TaxID=2072936 RepID=UPI000CD6BFBF|nr:hypothetical protein [Sphingobium sp. SCG-1]AUW57421.1 hypothetical protein C1T17_04205 [Sphingobium sp. SCG-1]